MMNMISSNGTAGSESLYAQADPGSFGPPGDRKNKCYEKAQHSTMEITSTARQANGVALAPDAECPEIEDPAGGGLARRRPHPRHRMANRRLQPAKRKDDVIEIPF